MSTVSRVVADWRVVPELVRRDIRVRFAGARFGLLWSILNPSIQLASYSLIFGYLYRGPGEEAGASFVASLFCGLWPWWGFQEGVMRGLSSLVDQAPLLRRVPMAPSACIVAAVTSAFILQAMGFALFLAVFAALGVISPSVGWVALPAIALLGWMLALTASLALAPLHLVVRDTVHVVSAMLLLGFFLSPVLYSTQWLPPAVQIVAALNPMTGLLGLYRSAVLGVPLPSALSVLALGVAIVGVALWARAVFGRLRPVLDEYW